MDRKESSLKKKTQEGGSVGEKEPQFRRARASRGGRIRSESEVWVSGFCGDPSKVSPACPNSPHYDPGRSLTPFRWLVAWK